MHTTTLKRSLLAAGTILSMSGLAASSANALATPITASGSTTASTSATQSARLAVIISKGNQEISRRLTTLNGLSSKISTATKLNAGDKASLSAEVSTQITNLNSLKATLDAETTVSGAASDVSNMYTEYRVYALVVPQVALVKFADDEQVTAGKLAAMEAPLQAKITADTGSNQASLQSELNDLTAKVSAAESTASAIETKVVALTPSDYDTDHSILSGDRSQLQTAHADNVAAYADAKGIVAALK